MSLTVTINFLGGPEDGWSRPYQRSTEPMPDDHAGYRLIGLANPTDTSVWEYRWVPPRTGRTQPCRAGDERGCPGARCPSHRQRQTA